MKIKRKTDSLIIQKINESEYFNFECNPKLNCFKSCCKNTRIYLSFLDIINIRNLLNITTNELLYKYTLTLYSNENKIPFVILNMNKTNNKTCPFLNSNGCLIYKARPWTCRMYPVGIGETPDEYILIKSIICKGFESENKVSVKEYLLQQKINENNKLNSLYSQIDFKKLVNSSEWHSSLIHIYYNSTYNIDTFKKVHLYEIIINKNQIGPYSKNEIEANLNNDIFIFKFAIEYLNYKANSKWKRFNI